MATSGQGDYLKIIYSENLKENKINNKFIAKSLNISAPSVSAMIKKLISDNFITLNKKLGIILTEQGINEVKTLLSKHRLWELFLIDKLNYSWDEVHEDADILEHVTSNKLLNKLNEYLKFPKTCPHGKPIYINNDVNSYLNTKKLSEAKVGFKGIIKVIEDNELLLKHLANKNIFINLEITVININSFDQSMDIKYQNQTTTLTIDATSKIFISANKN